MKFRISIWTKFEGHMSVGQIIAAGIVQSGRSSFITYMYMYVYMYDKYFYLMYFLAHVKDFCWCADKTDKVTGPL